MLVSGSSAVTGRAWARRLGLVLIVAVCGSLSVAASSGASGAAGGGLHILVAGNCFDEAAAPLATAIKQLPGVAKVTAVDTSVGTPSAATLKAQNLVVSLGDTCNGYSDAATWGNELADYVDHRGAVLQAAYDNWDANGQPGASPTGRFASSGYAPFELGPNDNMSTTLGELEVPNSPILKGLGTFANSDNTTDALASGATLLAKWADGRNAIAIKGRVVSTTASADFDANVPAVTSIARLALNTARFFSPPNTKISKASISSTKHQASFKFAAIGTAKGFQCALKHGKKAAFKSCQSPKTYKHLKPGKYTFEVRAVGSNGPDPTPAKKSFKISS
jgi:hypothetical protein